MRPLSFIRFPNQISKPVELVADRAYFVQVFQKEGGGGDHVSVGVKLPNGQMEQTVSPASLFTSSPGTLKTFHGKLCRVVFVQQKKFSFFKEC